MSSTAKGPKQAPETQDVKKVITVQEIMNRIGLTAFSVDFMKDPENALSFYRLEGEGNLKGKDINDLLLKAWEDLHFERIMKDVIEQTGADPEQLRDPEKRTDEQQQALLKASDAEQAHRMELFSKSKYNQAFEILKDIECKYHSIHDGDPEYIDLKEQSILYFFASHDNIDPKDVKPLTKEQKKDLIGILHRLDKFYLKEADEGRSDNGPEPTTLYRFIETDTNRPKIITKKIKEVAYPLDKVNSTFWSKKIRPKEKTALKAERDGDKKKGKKASIYVLLDFDEMKGTGVTISRSLTSYDKRVFIAVSNLKEQGHDTVTTSQICEAMGNRSRPSITQREKILKSIEEMSLCRVTLDNSEEANIYKGYDTISQTFYLLPTNIAKGYLNGNIVDDAITILETPKLFIFAKKRGQITSIPIQLLESPISQTEANLQIEDYLFTCISRMKNAVKRKKPTSTKILLDTLYKKCDIDDKHKRSRAPEKIERLLQYYQKKEFIKGFIMNDTSIDIYL